jgi:L-ornithine Nalpha-acyltransferase
MLWRQTREIESGASMAREEGNRTQMGSFGSALARSASSELPGVLASAGELDVRFATTRREIRRAQELRYRVFFEEGRAVADPGARVIGRDVCRFDRVCDHLIVVDNSVARLDGSPTIVGAYRLLRQEVAEANFGFYSAREFQVGPLIARHPRRRFLELGRSCVAPGYRGKRTIELLWRGIWAYATRHSVDVMFGCASFPGVDAKAFSPTMQFLRGGHEIEVIWRVDALHGHGVAGGVSGDAPLAPREALRAMPPLIKGYWRLGAKFSGAAVVDRKFGTTDLFVVLPIEDIKSRYLAYFAPEQELAPLAA